MKKGIHHVGLAVHSVDEVAKFLEEMFGGERTEYKMETPEFFSNMVQVGNGLFELLEPRGDKGLIERFLESNGEGLHHVSLAVDNLEEVLNMCDEKGMKLLGRRFIHPKSAHGILIELIDANQGQ